MTFEAGKEYSTIGGYPVYIYATDLNSSKEIHGRIFYNNTWRSCSWNRAGTFLTGNVLERDVNRLNLVLLVEVSDEVVEAYVQIFRMSSTPRPPTASAGEGGGAAAWFAEADETRKKALRAAITQYLKENKQ